MKVDKIIKMKDNKYKMIIDGESFITYDNVILNNDLLYKKSIDKDLFNKLIKDTTYYDIYNKTVKYILKKRRSKKEILKYLSKFDISDNDIKNIIEKLEGLKLINDLEYCRAYVNDKVYLSKNGINKIRIDLLEQDIPYNIIEQELNKVDKNIINARLEKLIIKKLNSNHKYSNSYIKQKILSEMINLGYSKETTLDIINKNIESDNVIIKKVFDKVYNKLKAKYNSLELENKVKQKMLQKGFKLEEVNRLLQQKTEE